MDEAAVRSPLSHADVSGLGRDLVERGEASGLHIRVVGGVGIWHSLPPSVREEYERHRPVPRDVDILAPPKTGGRIKRLMAEAGCAPDERLNAWRGDQRQRWFAAIFEGRPQVEVDVFIGRPPLCHEIELVSRLDAPPPTMRPTDLLLQKLQIVEINEKDLTDSSYLLLASLSGAGGFESDRVIDHLSRDWGFYYTATRNLEKLMEFAPSVLRPEEVVSVSTEVGRLIEQIEEAPKSMKWRMRAKVGTKAQWYEEVEEVER